ncbi:MAG: hypothetical protein F082_900 [bacterium F082]|nr:MAG: hypothetical protein F082_900 [bacterium F082]
MMLLLSVSTKLCDCAVIAKPAISNTIMRLICFISFVFMFETANILFFKHAKKIIIFSFHALDHDS